MFFEIIVVIPFVVLLLSIAVLPFIKAHWWHKNYPKLVAVLSALILAYYLVFLREPSEVLITIEEYLSFIALLFSLFVVSGGIFIDIKGRSSPLKNTGILLFGAVIANLFGTTGAAMLLIRSFINYNNYRIHPYHIIFFIFIVCNVGGSLTPIGDPPLFLGYLKGVPFFWTIEHLFEIWIITIAYLLVLFFIIDTYNYKKKHENLLPDKNAEDGTKKKERIEIKGAFNMIFLLMIIGSVFITEPIFIRELIMVACAMISYKLTSKKIHDDNKFNFGPIKEVAILFFGIFVTMIPALELLSKHADDFGLSHPGHFYWVTGVLTSFLDNAPTYLNFLTASMGIYDLSILNVEDVLTFIDTKAVYLVAISVSSVFFGAMTYIGNGPNFMVKSIADYNKINMPSFFGYMYKYSLVILLPFYFLLWYFIFR